MAKKKAKTPRPLSAETRKKREVGRYYGGIFDRASKTQKDNLASGKHPSHRVFKKAAKNAERRAKAAAKKKK